MKYRGKLMSSRTIKQIVVAILSIAVVSSSLTVMAQEDRFVFYENKTKAYFNGEFVDILDEEGITPTVKNGVFYVPIRPFVELRNGSIVWKANGNKIEADFAVGSYYTINQDSDTIIEFNGESSTLSAEVFLDENFQRLMVPSDTFEKLGYKVVLGDDYLGVFAVSENEDVVSSSFKTDSAIIQATVIYSMLNDDGYALIEDMSDTGSKINEVIGGLGASVNITPVGGAVNDAKISFTYDDEKLNGINENNLKIIWYNEISDKFEIVENSIVDAENNVVSADTSHFSLYSVVDSTQWYETWAKTQLISRDTSNGNGIYYVNLVLDTSGSMANSINLLKETVIKFIDELNDDDIINLITFSNGAKKVIDDQFKKDSDYSNVIKKINASGGTDMLEGLNAAKPSIYVSPLNPTPEELEEYTRQKEKETMIENATKITILLSDGQPDSDNSKDEIIDKCKELAKDGKIISLALGSGADTELMKKIADKTSHFYGYIKNSDELSEMFKKIGGGTIGVDSSKDTDQDGIPDIIETTGMRISTGEFICTDPNNWDTDGDYISDGDEMGTYDDENAFFRNESDPRMFTHYMDTSYVSEQPTISSVVVDYDGSIQCDVSFVANKREVKETTSFSATGNMVASSSEEYLYPAIQNAKIQISVDDTECLKVDKSSGNFYYSEKYGEIEDVYLDRAIKLYCENGINCNKDHLLMITVSGDNMDEAKFECKLDYSGAIVNKLQEDINKIQSAVSDQVATKVYNQNVEYNKIDDDIIDNIIVVSTSSASDYDMEQAIRLAIIGAITQETAIDELYSSNPEDFVKNCYKLMGSDRRKIEQEYNNNKYSVSWTGFMPKINNTAMLYLSVECYKSDTPNDKKNYTVTMKASEDFVNEFEKLLDDLNKKEMSEAGKKVVKAIIKEWGISSIIDELTDDTIEELGIEQEVSMFKLGKEIFGIKESSVTEEVANKLTEYTKQAKSLKLGDTMINKLIDTLVDVAEDL